jgi:tRNA pseudouridine38-40 synthase
LVARVEPGLDVALMNQAAELLLGRHDFASFCRVHTDVKTTFCNVMAAYWEDGVFHIQADRFLRNMVRAVVGTLFDVGRHKKSIEDFKQIIQAKNRCVAGQSAPAEGLYLVGIEYSEDIFIENI